MMNSTAPPFDDVRAREALAQATPIQKYLDLIGLGVNRPANQRVHPREPVLQPRHRPGG